MSKNMGKTKTTTDDLINGALAQQQNWHARRRSFARVFLTSLNVFAKPNPAKHINNTPTIKQPQTEKIGTIREYWFPIVCAFIVIFVVIVILYNHLNKQNTMVASVPEPITRTVAQELKTPMFDIVRISDNGKILVAGRWKPDVGISIFMNNKLVTTMMTDKNGEFVYAPTHKFDAGNYTISLMDISSQVKSEDKAFIYISDAGDDNSVSLLMTKNGSTVLQSPTILRDGDLAITKIDYLSNGRLIVTGDGLPRLRISATLNDMVLGTTKVSDYKHFGLGADVDELVSGNEYTLNIRMHDGDGNIIATVSHKFVMPKMTGDDDTYYTVRRGDCLWIIAKNFMRKGILFSIIATRNDIQNPDLIFPNQKLNIPVK